MAAESINSLLNSFDEELEETIAHIKNEQIRNQKNQRQIVSPNQIQKFIDEIKSLQNKTREIKIKIKRATNNGLSINNNSQAFINSIKSERNNIAREQRERHEQYTAKGGRRRRKHRRTHRRTHRQ